MEGIYFFGEYQRWNLGWSNPNQGGAFIAMLIPWFWVLRGWVASVKEDGARRSSHSLRRDAAAALVLLGELGLCFLLCKTYSRGALVAVGIAGGMWFAWHLFREHRLSGVVRMVVRLAAIGVLLYATGFFSRIDPRFVSQDASAGNRLVLWKGGLQMIAASPWRGWGAGESGTNFAHWFQPLDATERYAGMVNSYLHVAVEYGLPMFAAVMTGALGLLMISWRGIGARSSKHGLLRDAEATGSATTVKEAVMMAAGCSWLVFLIANVFSTLWVFAHLWWLPLVDGVVILTLGWIVWGSRFYHMTAVVLGVAFALSCLIAGGLFGMGKALPSAVEVLYQKNGEMVVTSSVKSSGKILILPDLSVLGDAWGKEIRRLAATEPFRGFEIWSLSQGSEIVSCKNPQWIMACGDRSAAGFATLQSCPDAHLVLVHPTGKPVVPADLKGRVSVMLPMLDTKNAGLAWKKVSKKMHWAISTTPGVGQDIRSVWPDVMKLERATR